MRRKSFFRENWGAYIVVPVLFSVLSLGVLFSLTYTFLSPYVGLVKLFMNESAQREPRNLMEDLFSAEEEEPGRDTIPVSSMTFPRQGDQYGTITVSGTAINCPVFYDADDNVLNQGAGTFRNSVYVGIPGESRTIFIMGHNHTFFSDLKNTKLGAVVTVETYYGTYTYEVIDMQVVDYQDENAYDLTRRDENLILYTCYPFNSIGFTPDRYVVYCKYVSGPLIDFES